MYNIEKQLSTSEVVCILTPRLKTNMLVFHVTHFIYPFFFYLFIFFLTCVYYLYVCRVYRARHVAPVTAQKTCQRNYRRWKKEKKVYVSKCAPRDVNMVHKSRQNKIKYIINSLETQQFSRIICRFIYNVSFHFFFFFSFILFIFCCRRWKHDINELQCWSCWWRITESIAW